MWNSKRSLILSLFFTYLFLGVLLACLFFAPVILRWFVQQYNRTQTTYYALVTVFYTAVVPAGAALLCLLQLLRNIMKDQPFAGKNITYIRVISWCCFVVSVIFFVSAFFDLPVFVFIAVITAFAGLILRVVKNVFASAVEIKAENELTV